MTTQQEVLEGNKLTVAQKREYDILKEYGSCTITDRRRNKVYMQLVKKGLAELPPKGSHNHDCYFSLTPPTPTSKPYRKL